MSILKGNVPIAGLQTNTIVSGFNIFDCKWSDHIINDIQWLRADTFSWQSGDVYTLAYNTLVNEYASGTTATEDGITFRRTTNGYKIADSTQESAILSKYNSKGIAWYYILDTTNHRFKLPRTKFGFKGLRGNVGDDIDERLPNITGDCVGHNGVTMDGAFSRDDSGIVNTGGGTYTIYQGHFDASRSSSTYQNGAPVQERATQMYLYFYVGEYAKTAIEQTAGITSEQLNNKMDLSLLSVIYPVGSIYIGTQATCPMASLISGSTWEQITGRYLLASGTIAGTSETVDANGYVGAGLPNITGWYDGGELSRYDLPINAGGALYMYGGGTHVPIGEGGGYPAGIGFSAANSNSTYGQSATVRPAGYAVNVWRRTA